MKQTVNLYLFIFQIFFVLLRPTIAKTIPEDLLLLEELINADLENSPKDQINLAEFSDLLASSESPTDETDVTSASDETDVTSDETDVTFSSDKTDVTSASDETDVTSDETDVTSSSDETSGLTDSTSPAPTIAPVTCDPSKTLASSGCNVSNYERCDNSTSLCVCNGGYAKPLSSTACIAIEEFKVVVTLSSSNSVNKRYRRDANDGNCDSNQVQEINDDILKSLKPSYQIVEDGKSIIEQCTVDGATGKLTAMALLKFKNDTINDQQIQDISTTIENSEVWSTDSNYVVDDASPATPVLITCAEMYCDPQAGCASNQTQSAYCSCNTDLLDFSLVGSSGQICLPKCESDCNGNGVCVSPDFKSTSCTCTDPYFTDSCSYNKNVVIGGSVAGGVVLIIIVIIITVCLCKKSKKSKTKNSRETLIEEVKPTFHIPRARV